MYWNDRRDQRNGQNITERAIHNNAMQNGVERRANIQRRRSAHRRTRAQPISSRMNDRKIGTYIAYVRQTVHEHGANKAQRARKPSTTELYNESSANINFVFPFIYSLRREISSYRFPSQKAIIYIGWFYNTVCSYLSLSLNAVYAVWPHITNAIRNDNWSKNGWIGSLSLSGRRDGKALLIDRTCTICPPPKCGYRTQEFSVTFNFVSHVNRTEDISSCFALPVTCRQNLLVFRLSFDPSNSYSRIRDIRACVRDEWLVMRRDGKQKSKASPIFFRSFCDFVFTKTIACHFH